MEFTKLKYIKLKGAYRNAVRNGKDQFVFEGQAILTSYAKYLIQYLEMKFGK